MVLIFWCITSCLRRRVSPQLFFQLNSEYFNPGKNIFSKLDMDRVIPDRWRLRQIEDDGQVVPEMPVFLKPEWGQNSHGIYLIQTMKDLEAARRKRRVRKTSYLFQEVAREKKEYEIFYIRSASDNSRFAILSITEVRNSGHADLYINGVHNADSSYHDITTDFSAKEQQQLWTMLKGVGRFRIARVGIRANSRKELLSGIFHIIEINIFLPLPLLLLDKNISWSGKHQFIRKSMVVAADLISNLPASKKRRAIFFRQLIAHYRVKGY
jgi:hypothetical protein